MGAEKNNLETLINVEVISNKKFKLDTRKYAMVIALVVITIDRKSVV